MNTVARGDRFGLFLALVLGTGLVVSVVLAVSAAFMRSARASEHELARIGLEDVARRVEQGARNLASVRAMSDAVALSRARSLAQLIAENPKVLGPANRARFEGYAKMLGVDELHVTDARGVLVRTLPAVYEGYSMDSSSQSAAFMPAITNAAFALVQEPQVKGLATGDGKLDRALFQYAGVARRDAPGIVQVGYRAARVAEAMRLADVDEIAATARVGRCGRVRIVKDSGRAGGSAGFHYELDAQGRRLAVFETICAGYRVSVVQPENGSWLARENAVPGLFVLSLVLLFLFVFALPAVRRLLARDLGVFREQLGTVRSTSFMRVVTSPLALGCFAFFAMVLLLLGFAGRYQARHAAEERLRAAAEDMVEELDGCVDELLAFIGWELCQAYRTPEAMAEADLRQMMKTYFVDEINVVDGQGICISSTVPAICRQNQWRYANPAKFCKALIQDGSDIFSQPFRNSATEDWIYRKYVGVSFPKPARGYVQIGFDRARLGGSVDYRLRDLAHAWHIGETGFYVISRTSNGQIISTQDDRLDGETLAGVGFDVFAARTHQNVDARDPVSRVFLGFRELRFFESTFAGEPCLCTSGVVNQYHRYTAMLPLSEVYGPARRGLVTTALVLFVALVVVVSFLSRLTNLVASLREKERVERERQLQDLMLAKTIQSSSLPVSFPDERDYSLTARMETAREVGGDFYDYFTLPSGRICFLIADVSGKGVPAALFMMRAKTTLRAAMHNATSLAEAVAQANDSLAEKNEAEMFVTAWVGVFDRMTGEVEFVNAGHNPPLLKHADGRVDWLRARGGLVLAAMPGVPYRTTKLTLSSGDSVFLYTDGVTEAMNGSGELYGEARLERIIRDCRGDMIADLRTDLTLFVAGAEPSDDITMLTLEYK